MPHFQKYLCLTWARICLRYSFVIHLTIRWCARANGLSSFFSGLLCFFGYCKPKQCKGDAHFSRCVLHAFDYMAKHWENYKEKYNRDHYTHRTLNKNIGRRLLWSLFRTNFTIESILKIIFSLMYRQHGIGKFQ